LGNGLAGHRPDGDLGRSVPIRPRDAALPRRMLGKVPKEAVRLELQKKSGPKRESIARPGVMQKGRIFRDGKPIAL
jgi:hypothetical protein